MLLFKTYTLEFEFDGHLEHMVSYHRMQNGLPVFVVGEFGTLEIFGNNDCFLRLYSSYFSNYNLGQNMIIFSFLLITNQLYFDSGSFI